MPIDHSTENWRDIPNAIGYQASDLGNLRSRWRIGVLKKGVSRLGDSWHPITLCKTDLGYLYTSIRHTDGRYKTRLIYRLVLEAFVGPRPPGMHCRHLDGNPANNRLDNLRWGTVVENARDRKRHGTNNDGSRNGQAKLSESDVQEIRSLLRSGVRNCAICRRFGLSHSTISNIRTGTTWSHLD